MKSMPVKTVGGLSLIKTKSSDPNIVMKNTTEQEIKFYEQVFTSNDPQLTQFRKFIPKFYG